MTYVLKRHEDGAYVAPAGSANSYTKKLQNARRWALKDDAQREACGNESVIRYEEA